MKKNGLSILLFLTFSFLLSGLQGCFYFLPIAMPYFWFTVFVYYSFKKSFLFSLVTNLFHVFVIAAFSSVSLSLMIIALNLLSLSFVAIRERFHTGPIHMAFASGAGTFTFLAVVWSIQSLAYDFYYPPILDWISISLMTLIVSPLLIRLLSIIDEKIYYERVDTLENLRI